MKLLNRTMLYYLSLTLLIFGLGGIVTYHYIRGLILQQVNQGLLTEKKIIEDQIKQSDSIPDLTDLFDHQIEVKLLKYPIRPTAVFKDSLLEDSVKGQLIPYRFLVCQNNLPGNRSYFMKTSLPIQEEDNLAYDILSTLIVSFLLLLFFLAVINYGISKVLLRSFYTLLKNIRNFDLKKASTFVPVSSSIKEFMQLSRVLQHLTKKISSDYANLKEFSENISHEIQTPLSIIRSRVEYLYQMPELNEKTAENLNVINQSVTRISRINQALILISKIQNNQFSKTELVLFKKKLTENLSMFTDLIESKNIKLEISCREEIKIRMNQDLADILLANLISNAVKHNIPDGKILIRINSKQLIMENTGHTLDMDPAILFKRFAKADISSSSPGLGLAIIHKIVELYDMKITYTVKKNLHQICIQFPVEKQKK